MLALLQSETERILEQALAEHGVPVEWSTTFQGLEATAERVLARLAAAGNEQVVEAAWLLGADGAHSTVRDALGLPFHGTTDPIDALVEWLQNVRREPSPLRLKELRKLPRVQPANDNGVTGSPLPW